MVPQGPKLSPANEKPIIIFAPAEIIKLALAASPPEALLIVAPSTLNWKPPISEDEL